MVTKKTGRPRGRPQGSTLKFLDDPDRYRLALIDALMVAYHLNFEAAARLALGIEGREVPTGKLSRAAQKRLAKGWTVQTFERTSRNQKIDSQIDNLRLKSKRFADDELAQRWLHNMRTAWLKYCSMTASDPPPNC